MKYICTVYVQINTSVSILIQLLIRAITITHQGVIVVVGVVVVCIGTVNKLKCKAEKDWLIYAAK